MSYHINIQNTLSASLPINKNNLKKWATLAASYKYTQAELNIRIIDTKEMQALNNTYRKHDKPTNVLAFPVNLPKYIKLKQPMLGDVVICPEVLFTESLNLNCDLNDHWAHIIIHGVLHLMGYDHIDAQDAEIMQGSFGIMAMKKQRDILGNN